MSDSTWKRSVLADLLEDTIGGLWGSPPDSKKADEIDVLVVRGADFRNWSARRAQDAAPRRVPARSLERRRLEPGDLVLEVSGGSPAQRSRAREYLEQRGLPADTIERCGLGVVTDLAWSRRALHAAGYSEPEIARSNVLADSRWGGRVCGAWRDESGSVRTLWARALDDDTSPDSRYLYLRGAGRTGLPPYGLSQVLKQPPSARRELVLVEGLFDVHQLRSRGMENVAALGGTGVSAPIFERLARLGFERVTVCLDRDGAGRVASARAIEQAAHALRSPAIFVVDPEALAPSKDPDALIRERGLGAWFDVLSREECGVTWRARELLGGVTPEADSAVRRAALSRAGAWLGTLTPRLALEQEDAVRAVAERCGYSRPAVERAFRARYWRQAPERTRHQAPERECANEIGMG